MLLRNDLPTRLTDGGSDSNDLPESVLATEEIESERSVGAIFAEDRAAVATMQKQLLVYGWKHDAAGHYELVSLAKRAIGFAAYDISVATDEIAIVEARPKGHAPELYDRIFSESDDVAGQFETSGERWATVLHRYDRNGSPRASVGVPFEALQPPVLCNDGRVYLAGRGLAAIDGGKVTWMQSSPNLVRATAFENGDLAVTEGAELRIVRTDGTIAQTFHTEEPIVTPPAIGADGAVWVATRKALYVAR